MSETTQLQSRVDQLEQTVKALIGTLTDSADEAYRQAAESGIDIEQRVRLGLALVERLTAPGTADRLTQLLDLLDQGADLTAMAVDAFDQTCREALSSGIDPQSLTQLAGRLARAASHCQRQPPPPLGLFGLLGAARDPEVQRGLGLLVEMARQLGATQQESHNG